MTKYKVLLQDGCWIANWESGKGWHGRTLVESSAMLFKARKAAKKQLDHTRLVENKAFSQAEIIEVNQ